MKLFSSGIGIDLGTTYVLVYVPQKGVIINEPSIIAVSKDSGRICAVGDEAKQMLGRTPESIEVHRPMKDGVIADYKVTEVMLRYFIRKAIGKYNPFKPQVVVSVPAGVTSTERRAVVEAAKRAGAKDVYVSKEPILAAIGAGVKVHESQGHMIVDAGGGTIDVAIISLGGIVKCTSVKCAGNRIDQAIMDYMRKNLNLAIGYKTAEAIKIKVGSAIPMKDELSMKVTGRDVMTGLPRVKEVRTNEIVRAIGKELNEMINAIKSVFNDIMPELAEDIMENGIIMTGGTSQLRNFQQLVEERTGVFATLAERSQYCVACGTGTVLKYLDTYKHALVLNR